MKIGELSKQTGISVHTLRFYEKQGILKASGRSINNYRVYTHDDLVTAKFIQRCKDSGFSLQETSTLIGIKEDKSQHVCAEAKEITNQKITQITEQITHLQNMLVTLKELEQYCCGGQKSAEFCTIIAALEDKQVGESKHDLR